MSKLRNLLAGGFLAGKRTYLLGWMMVAQSVVQWAVGDAVDWDGLLPHVPDILEGLGFVTLRARLQSMTPAPVELVAGEIATAAPVDADAIAQAVAALMKPTPGAVIHPPLVDVAALARAVADEMRQSS